MADFKSGLKLHGIKQISCVYRIITIYYNAISYYLFNELRPKDDAVNTSLGYDKKITPAGSHPVQEAWGSQVSLYRSQIEKLLQCCRDPYQQIPLVKTIKKV